MSNPPRDDKPKSFFELLAERLLEATEVEDAAAPKFSAEDSVIRQRPYTEAELQKVEEDSCQAWKYVAASMSGAFNALCEMNFDPSQAMEVILTNYEYQLWKDAQ